MTTVQVLGNPRERNTEDFSFIEALTLDPHPSSPTQDAPRNLDRSLPPIPTSPLFPAHNKQIPPAKTNINHEEPKAAQAKPAPAKQDAHKNMAPAANMASAKAVQSCLDTCLKTTKLGDRVSIRLLEHLTIGKETSETLDQLAHSFLDICQILFSIEAGLDESTRTAQFFPSEVVAELDKKFRIAQADFQNLENMISKSLEYERKGAMGRMRRGWGKMFGEGDYTKTMQSLDRTRDSLKMSALMFQWSLGSDKIDNELSIGYTALAAALDRLDKDSASQGNGSAKGSIQGSVRGSIRVSESGQHHQSMHHLPQHQQKPHHPQSHLQHQTMSNMHSPRTMDVHQMALPPLPWAMNHGSPLDSSQSFISDARSSTPYDSRHTSHNTASSSTSYNHTHSMAMSRFDEHPEETASNSDSIASDLLLEELMGPEFRSSKSFTIRAEPMAMPRWNPRNDVGADGAAMKGPLLSAIRTKNHKLLNNFLDQGVPTAPSMNFSPLKEAVTTGDVESVRLLLVFGADPNEPDVQGTTPLMTAVEKSSFSCASMLLKYGADPNRTILPETETPLGMAVLAHKVNLVHLLLIYGGDPSQLTIEGNTLLIAGTAKKSPKKLVDLLLEYGADPNAKSTEGKSALFEAITSARADIVTSLLDKGADPNLPGPKHMLWPGSYQSACLQLLLSHGADFKKTPGIMELATSINNIESVRILLKAGVDPNAKKDGVYTPLCTSIRDNRPDIFHLLLNNGANPNTPASEYPCFKCITHHRVHFLPDLVAAGGDLHSPKGIMETAVSSYDMDALNWLLDQGMNPNDRNPKGESPLTTAIRDKRLDMVEVLLSRGADPNMRGEDWPVCLAVHNPPILQRVLSVLAEPRAFKGVMEMAVVANQLDSVKLLIAAGVSVEDKNGGVFSPLTTAIRENRKEIVVFLLNEGGADVNSPGEHLPIVKALRRFRGQGTEMLELLLERGADPNLVYRGWNGMMQAVENGDADVLQLLCNRVGVDLTVQDELGRTVTEIAASRGWDEAVNILHDGRKK